MCVCGVLLVSGGGVGWGQWCPRPTGSQPGCPEQGHAGSGLRFGVRQCGGQAAPHGELAIPRLCPGIVFIQVKFSGG